MTENFQEKLVSHGIGHFKRRPCNKSRRIFIAFHSHGQSRDIYRSWRTCGNLAFFFPHGYLSGVPHTHNILRDLGQFHQPLP